MKNSLQKFILLCLLTLSWHTASADSYIVSHCKVGGIYYRLINYDGNKTAIVTYKHYDSADYSGSVIIPPTLTHEGTTYDVIGIDELTFRFCTELTSVTIPNSVKTIGSEAFEGCSNLTSINIPDGVTTIGGCTFQKCSSLTSINIPNSVTTIGHNAFSGCSSLTSINIPNSVTSIGEWSFSGCSSLTSINIPNSVTTIGHNAFSGCSSLTSINIPNSVTSIGERSFSGCSSLTSINIPNSITSIGEETFYNCNSLTSINIPNSVTSIGERAFYGCNNLLAINVEKANTVYDSRNDCNALIETASNTLIKGCQNTVIPNDVTSIGDEAFTGCSGLTTITIPNSVATIGDYAFYDCNCFIICNRETPPNVGFQSFAHGFGFTYNKSVTIVPESLNEVYKQSEGWKETNIGAWNSFVLKNTTQTTVTLATSNQLFSNTSVSLNGTVYTPDADGKITITGLTPGEKYIFSTTGCYEGVELKNSLIAYTKAVSVNVTLVQKSYKSLRLQGAYDAGDATVIGYGFSTGVSKKTELTLQGLDPNSKYNVAFYVETTEGGRITREISCTTDALILTTLQPKVISVGNVIVAAQSNLDDDETNVGFEWRRTDWTNDFASQTGEAVLYEGAMEGYIRNMNADKLWKFRPYYTAQSGNTYYGEWVGLDPSNTAYFEPTVHTYAKLTVEGNTVSVKGYAMRGTDAVKEQGFKYWKLDASAKNRMDGQRRAVSIPSDAMTVLVSGQVMTTELIELDFDSEYCCVAFVTTSEGETFYGEEQRFTTGADPTGIGNITVAEDTVEPRIKKGVYTLQGVKVADESSDLKALPRGIYIVHGKKVLVR